MTSLLDQYEQNSQRSMGPVSPPTPVGSDVVSLYYLFLSLTILELFTVLVSDFICDEQIFLCLQL